jgi:hypothetical protein
MWFVAWEFSVPVCECQHVHAAVGTGMGGASCRTCDAD